MRRRLTLDPISLDPEAPSGGVRVVQFRRVTGRAGVRSSPGSKVGSEVGSEFEFGFETEPAFEVAVAFGLGCRGGA